ncbi:hypothetical protein [Streptomyces himalayensis]|uniref:hypothetical protein n=1 Tax=Streptomyces himalayensis TaxID=2820085 RepID=UPI00215D9CBB|nr:hypothetical protein [Streptomyces himalayensis]
MLRCVYQAADLEPGVITDWREERGLLEIRIARHARPSEFAPSLNATLLDFLATAEWYQIWNGEVISVNSPGSPLRATVELSRLHDAPPVDIREHKGHVIVDVSPTTTVDEFVATLNPSLEIFLAGGQWFQLWQGEIVTMDSPGAMAA